MSDPKHTPGYRRNNPFDLEVSKPQIPWHGLTGHEGVFLTFDTPLNGLRNGYRDLRMQQKLHGLRTVRGIVEKFAPPEENDTAGYIARVCKSLCEGLGREISEDDELDMEDPATLRWFGDGCLHMEIGGVPYDEVTIQLAVKEALS